MIKLLAQLYRDEGEVLHAYQDTLGFWTIGIGRLIDERKGGGITKDESNSLLLNDIKTHTLRVIEKLPWAIGLSEARLGVLINMHFQLGDGVFLFTVTLGLVKAKKYTAASKEMLASKWAQQTPARAKRLAEQMRTDVWQ